MKYLIPIALVLIFACTKKNNTTGNTGTIGNSGSGNNTTTQIGINKFTFSNCSAANKLIQKIGTQNTSGAISPAIKNLTNIQIIYDTLFPSLLISTKLMGIGIDTLTNFMTYNANLSMPQKYSCTPTGTLKYAVYSSYDHNTLKVIPGNIIAITKFDTIGGLIEGGFKLKLINILHPTDTTSLSGQFCVIRKM